MMHVRLDCAGRVPPAHRQAAYAGQRLAAGALELVLVQQAGQIRVGINDADEIGQRTHAHSPVANVTGRTLRALASSALGRGTIARVASPRPFSPFPVEALSSAL